MAALAGGCAATDTGDDRFSVVVDPCQPVRLAPAADVREAELASVGDAAAMWARLGYIGLADGDRAHPATQVIEIRFEEAADMFHGLYDDHRGIVFVNRRLSDRHQRAVTVAHELGHAFALEHVFGRSSVMNTNNLVIEPNLADADQLAALWGRCD